MALVDESDFLDKEVDVKDHFAALQRTMIEVQQIDTETISSQLSSLAEVMGDSLQNLAEGKINDKEYFDIQKYLDKLGLMAEESANVIKQWNAYTKEVANSKDEEEALGKMIDANMASMDKINQLEREREDLAYKFNNHGKITQDFTDKINNLLERRETYQETSNNLVNKYNAELSAVEEKLKAENLGHSDIARLQQEKIDLEGKINEINERTTRFLENSRSLQEDLKIKLREQQQLYESAPDLIEEINSKLREEVAFNDIIKKDLANFSSGMEKFGLMNDKSRKKVEKILGVTQDINKELLNTIESEKTHTKAKKDTIEIADEQLDINKDNLNLQNKSIELLKKEIELLKRKIELEKLLQSLKNSIGPGMFGGGGPQFTATEQKFMRQSSQVGDTGLYRSTGIGDTNANVRSGGVGVGFNYQNLNSGGLISGPKGKDVIPAMLTHGEFVINAGATKQFLPLLEKLNSGEITSFAEGGGVNIGAFGANAKASNDRLYLEQKRKEDLANQYREEQIEKEASKHSKNSMRPENVLSWANGGAWVQFAEDLAKQEGKEYIPEYRTDEHIGAMGQSDWNAYQTLNKLHSKDGQTDHRMEDRKYREEHSFAYQQQDKLTHELAKKHLRLGNKITARTETDPGEATEFKNDLIEQQQKLSEIRDLALKKNEIKLIADGIKIVDGEISGYTEDRVKQINALEQEINEKAEASGLTKFLGDDMVADLDFGIYRELIQTEITGVSKGYETPLANSDQGKLFKLSDDQMKEFFSKLTDQKRVDEQDKRILGGDDDVKRQKIVEFGRITREYLGELEEAAKAAENGVDDIASAIANSRQRLEAQANKIKNIRDKAIDLANSSVFDVVAENPMFSVSKYAELNNSVNEFWNSTSESLNQSHQEIKAAIQAVADAGGEGLQKLNEMAMQTKVTFNLVGDSLSQNLKSVRDSTIDLVKELKEASKSGKLLDLDLDEQIEKLQEQIKDQDANIAGGTSTLKTMTNLKSQGIIQQFSDPEALIRNNAITIAHDMLATRANRGQDESQRIASEVGIAKAKKSISEITGGGFSTGGFVSGPMGRDVIPAMLTDGEFVIRADVAKKWRGFLEHLNKNGHLGFHGGGPVMLETGGGVGSGSSSSGTGGGGADKLKSLENLLADNNANVQSTAFILEEIVGLAKKLNDEGMQHDQIQEALNKKYSDVQTILEQEIEMQVKLRKETKKQLEYLTAMKELKMAGLHDALIGTFDAVEQKILSITDSIPFIGTALSMSIKASVAPAFDALREGASSGFMEATTNVSKQLKDVNPEDIDIHSAINIGMDTFKKKASEAKEHMQMIYLFVKKIGIGTIAMGAALFGFVALVGLALKRFFQIDQLAHDFRKELGLSAKVTKNLERETVKVQRSLARYGVSLEEAFDSAKALTDVLGSTAMVTEKNIKLVALLQNGMGIASETGAQVYETFKLISGGSSEIATNLSYVTSELAAAAGVPLSKVMGDIAGASDSVYAFVRGSGEELAVAAVEARRLGTNIEEIAGSMESMLDFESSITKEMRMATMLGRHINLDSLRRASYEGNMVKYMAEESKILERIGDLTKMNSYERKTISEALGKDVKTLMKQQQHMKQIEAMRNGTIEQQRMAAKYDEARRMALEGETKSLAEQGMERLKAEDNANVRNRLANQFNRLLDELGSVLLPVVETSMNILIPILDHLISGFGYLVKIVEFLLQPFIFIFNTLSAIGSITGLWEGSLDGLKSQFDGLGASLFAIGGILLSFTPVGKQMIANLTGLFKPITGLIGKGFNVLFKNITGSFGDVMKSASEIVSDGTEGIFMTFTNNAKKIGPFLKDGFLKGIDGLKKLGPSFSSFISNSMGGIKSLGGALLGAFKEPGKAINTLKSTVTTLFTSGLEGSKTLGKSLLNAFKNPRATLSSLFGALSGFFSSGMKGAKGLKDSLVGAFKGGGEGGGIKGMASKVKDMFGAGSVRGLKKDGTPDMRFKENKIKAAEQANTTKVGASDKSKDVSNSTKGGKKGASGFDKFVKSFNKIDMKQVLKGAAALAILSGALYIAGKAFQQFSKVDWEGVAKGATGLAVMIGGLWAMSKFIDKAGSSLIKGAVAIALLGASLLPAAFAFQMFGDVSWGDVIYGAVALGVLTAAAFGLSLIAVPVAIGAGVLALLGAALIPLAYALNIATPALEAFGGVINSMGSAISGIIDSMFGGLSRLAELDGVKLLGVAGGLTAVGAAMVALGAGQGIGAFLSMFASDDPFSVYIRLGDNAEKINTGADSLRNVAGAISELSKNDAEDILGDLGDGFEDLFDEIEDIDEDAITRFVSVGTSFKGIGEGMTALDKGIAPMSQLLTLLGNQDIYAVAVSGLDAMTQSILKFTEALEELGTFGTILMGIMTAGGGIPKPTTEVVNQTTGEEPPIEQLQKNTNAEVAQNTSVGVKPKSKLQKFKEFNDQRFYSNVGGEDKFKQYMENKKAHEAADKELSAFQTENKSSEVLKQIDDEFDGYIDVVSGYGDEDKNQKYQELLRRRSETSNAYTGSKRGLENEYIKNTARSQSHLGRNLARSRFDLELRARENQIPMDHSMSVNNGIITETSSGKLNLGKQLPFETSGSMNVNNQMQEKSELESTNTNIPTGVSSEEMASGGAGTSSLSMPDVVQQVASVPPPAPMQKTSSDDKGVEAKLDELINLMKSGGIAVNMDGKKVSTQLAKASP